MNFEIVIAFHYIVGTFKSPIETKIIVACVEYIYWAQDKEKWKLLWMTAW